MLIQHTRTPHRDTVVPPASLSIRCTASRGASRGIDPLVDRALALAGAGAWSCNLADNRLNWTSGIYALFGLPIETALDRRETVAMYTDESRDAMERLRAKAIASAGIFTLDAEIVRPDGEKRWMRINGEMVRRPGGRSILHGLKQDVTDEKMRAETLRRLAENDALTSLANRAVYENRFLNRRCDAAPVAPLGALILFDLDGFKGINDRLGHLAGDACLRVFAERLSASFPDAMLAARIGGDEFAVIVGNDEPRDLIDARVARFQAQLRAPFLWQGHMVTIGATSGVAVPADASSYDPEELFGRADAALYAAKKARRV